jgi:DNA-binding CsgD family transcriptional regulator
MFSESEISKLILLAYEAATELSLWPAFLKRYTEALEADLTALQIHYFNAGHSEVVAQFGINPSFNSSYNAQYSKRNLWRDCGRKVYRTGVVLLEEEICPRSLTLKSEFYHDYLVPMGSTRSLGPVIHRDEQRAVTIPSMRIESREPFGEEQRMLARQLLPHVTRAFQILERLHVLKASEDVIGSLPFGVAFLTNSGYVVYSNRAAEQIFEEADGIRVQFGTLTGGSRQSTSDLKAAIDQAAHVDRTTAWPRIVLIERPSLRRSYQVLTFPVRGGLPQFRGLRVPSLAVFIVDPEQQLVQAPEILADMFGLTRKEAEVAARLAEGKSVQQLAGELGMRYETARTHMRRIFDKTSTSRQSGLVSLIARISMAGSGPKNR